MNDIAFIIPYFNYCGYKQLKSNLLQCLSQFRGVKTLVIECAFEDKPFEIENSYRVRTNSVLFQKERLLMLGAEQLWNDYEKLCFIDSDVMFENDDWLENISKCLDQVKVAQGFQTVQWKFNDVTLFFDSSLVNPRENKNFISYQQQHGLLWCFRSEVLKQCPIYQHAIIGNGDTGLLLGTKKATAHRKTWAKDVNNSVFAINPKVKEFFINWAEKWSDVVGKDYGFAPNRILTLPHGSIKKRRYRKRHNLLRQFDPQIDVVLPNGQPIQWSNFSIPIVEELKEYFRSREEDE